MLNSVGLQNPGLDVFLERELPFMRTLDTAVIANIAGHSTEDYLKMTAVLGAPDCLSMRSSSIYPVRMSKRAA
jgi:dihydroorotate dehydrogenase (NAD+) catalytic subunit